MAGRHDSVIVDPALDHDTVVDQTKNAADIVTGTIDFHVPYINT